jgi:hypothetical protein
MIFTDSSITLFLKNGKNIITPSEKWENHNLGYSIICFNGCAKVKIYENDIVKTFHSSYDEINYDFVAGKINLKLTREND